MKASAKIQRGQLYGLRLTVATPQLIARCFNDLPLTGIEKFHRREHAIGGAKPTSTERCIPNLEADITLAIRHPKVDGLVVLPEFPLPLRGPYQFPRHVPSLRKAVTYVYRWDRHNRKGQICRVFARGTMNSVGLEFEDGFRMVSSGNALRRA